MLEVERSEVGVCTSDIPALLKQLRAITPTNISPSNILKERDDVPSGTRDLYFVQH